MTHFSASASRSRRATASVVAGMTLAGAAAVGFSAPAQAASIETWDKVAQCESGGDWSINTGNGFYGGVQFALGTWTAFGGQGQPQNASKSEQIRIAEKVLAEQGWRAWPACSLKLGLRAEGEKGVPSASVAAAPAVERQSSAAAAEKAAAQRAAAAEQAAAERWAAQQAAAQERAAERAAAQRAERAAEKRAQAAQASERAQEKRSERAAAVQAERQSVDVTPAAAERTIVVKAGDTLNKLAAQHGIDGGWEALYEANQDVIDDPNLIYLGQEFVLPQG